MSTVELVLYMPLLMLTILLAVQFALVYLGNQVASAAARESSRVLRVTGDTGAARARANSLIDDLGDGLLESPQVTAQTFGDRVRMTVSGRAVQIIPGVPIPRVIESVEGPREEFRPDTGTP